MRNILAWLIDYKFRAVLNVLINGALPQAVCYDYGTP